MTIQTIVLAVGPSDGDRTERLAESVVEVADPTGASVVLTHAFTEDEYDSTRDRLDFANPNDATPDEVASRHATIRDLANHLDDAAVDYSVKGAVGDHGRAIVDVAESVSADRVYVAGRKRSPTGKAVFGSTAQEVMLSAPCPVTFVRD
ncbi:universal stress protein [Haloarchaeobius sp. DYHT-AS-18]|uniref:universal stress protein n=1 Tax=Haloarchaeobius sp. DYHT-AS-18 TaxID=3446117 RepID=UPI003EC0E8EE